MSRLQKVTAPPERCSAAQLCRMLGIEHPIFLAGMPGVSGPNLTAAISNAGGLGVLGVKSCRPDELSTLIRRTRALTDRPFGISISPPVPQRRLSAQKTCSAGSPEDEMPDYLEFVESFMEEHGLNRPTNSSMDKGVQPDRCNAVPLFTQALVDAQIQVAIDERVALLAVGLGDALPALDRLHANGILVAATVGTVQDATRMARHGVDIVIAQGHEAGGPNAPVGTMALVPQVVDALGPGVPVLAAGGIGDGRGVAASLMLGASGSWIGSAFLAAREACLAPFQKQVLVDAQECSTVVSRAVTGEPLRVLRSRWTEVWSRAEIEPLPAPYQSKVSAPVLSAALKAGRADVYSCIAGQAIGLIESVRPASDIFDDFVSGMREALGRQHELQALCERVAR